MIRHSMTTTKGSKTPSTLTLKIDPKEFCMLSIIIQVYNIHENSISYRIVSVNNRIFETRF